MQAYEWILLCALLLHVFFSVTFFLLVSHRTLHIRPWMALLIFLLPFWGLILALLLHFRRSLGLRPVKEDGLEKFSVDSELYRAMTVDTSRVAQSTVSMEEALVVNSAKERRSIIMDVLNDNPKEYIEFLKKAGNNDDTEVVHYAVTAMVQIAKENDFMLWEYEKQHADDPNNAAILADYTDFLWQCLEQGLMQGQVEKMNRTLFAELSQKKLALEPVLRDYVGLFSHLIIFWFSDIGVPVKGLFYGAPYHDVAALIAFLTMLVTTVNFVVSVEVHFYPKYRYYNSLYSDRGTARDISQAQVEMIRVLRTEIFYTALKQLLTTALAVAVGSYILDLLPLGFNELMKGYFRTLCVAYGLYAIGNMLMLIQLYFVDYAGAFWSTAIFAVSTIVLTVISSLFPRVYYGFGFLLASLLFLLIAIVRLDYYTKRLPYYILCIQPLVAESKTGPFARLACKLDNCFAKEEHPES